MSITEKVHKFPQKRRLVGNESEEEFDDSDDEETSFVAKTTRLTKDILYYVTDSERLLIISSHGWHFGQGKAN
jgi:hypothetical protein